MSKRQVIILWAAAAVLALLVIVIKIAQGDPDQVSTEREPGETLFESFPAKQISRVVVEGPNDKLVIEQSGEQWVLQNRDNYPADTTLVLELIRVLNDLEITRAIEAAPSLAPRFGMDPNGKTEEERGLEIGFFNKGGKELARVTLGKIIETGINEGLMGGSQMVGRYIRNHADESGFYASSELFPAFTDVASSWLRDLFINPEKIESIIVHQTDAGGIEWHLKRETEEATFQVVGGAPNEVANTNLAGRLGTLFSYARFVDVVPAKDVPQRMAKEGRLRAVIKTFEGFDYSLRITPTAKEDDDQYLLQVMVKATLPKERKKEEGESPEDAAQKDKAFADRLQHLKDKLSEAKFFEGRTYLMDKSSVDLLLYKRGEMVVSAAPEPAPAPAPGPGQVPPLLTPPGQP